MSFFVAIRFIKKEGIRMNFAKMVEVLAIYGILYTPIIYGLKVFIEKQKNDDDFFGGNWRIA